MKMFPMPMCVAQGQVHWPSTATKCVLGVAAIPRQVIPKGQAGASQKTPPDVPWLPSYKKRSVQQQLSQASYAVSGRDAISNGKMKDATSVANEK